MLRDRLLVVCCPRRPVGLASSRGWRCSCSCFESILIDARLELLGVARSVRRAGPMYNLQPASKGWFDEGVPAASPMPKSVSFL